MPLTAYINLTEKSIKIEQTDVEIFTKFIGCRGYAAKLLYDMTGPQVKPFDPENALIFSTGLLTGTPWPTSARYHVTCKSPLTGVYGYGNSGGFFGPALRHAGFDALVITGIASSPQYLLIESGKIEICEADHLWGKTTHETEDILKEQYPKCRVAGIGPAGENMISMASIINDHNRAAARSGVGAVMGSKKLKAIVVRRTSKPAYPAPFRALVKKVIKKVTANSYVRSFSRWGTPAVIDPKNMIGDLPARNHQLAQAPFIDKVNAEAVEKYVIAKRGCYACPIKCSRISKVNQGKYKCEVEGPEYETIDAFGPLLWNDNMEAIIYANLLCNQLGMDTISTGVTIAFAMECRQHGLLNDDELSLQWGDTETIIELIKKIAYRQGIGELLCQGVRKAAADIGGGAEKFAMHVKGMELPRQEPRVAKAFGLGHGTSNRGADHLYALPTIDIAGHFQAAKKLFPQYLPEFMEVTSEKGKPDLVIFTEAFSAIADSAGICKFSCLETYALYPEDIAEGFSALGIPHTAESLLEAGERIVNLERMYNVREGLDRKDDLLPKRFLTEKLKVSKDPVKDISPQAPLPGQKQPPSDEGLLIDQEAMLDRYYQLRGWDSNGIPTAEKLKTLGLDSESGERVKRKAESVESRA
ncbi:MAG: aldehyde ferredoxin oxidoreductase family protein [Methanosarcinaceae archaeon]